MVDVEDTPLFSVPSPTILSSECEYAPWDTSEKFEKSKIGRQRVGLCFEPKAFNCMLSLYNLAMWHRWNHSMLCF